MTNDDFDTVEVGDVLLAANGRHMHVTEVDRDAGKFGFYWEAGVKDIHDHAGDDYEHYRNFSYIRHISKGVRYGTHRTLRHQADFKTKP